MHGDRLEMRIFVIITIIIIEHVFDVVPPWINNERVMLRFLHKTNRVGAAAVARKTRDFLPAPPIIIFLPRDRIRFSSGDTSCVCVCVCFRKIYIKYFYCNVCEPSSGIDDNE